MAPNLTNQVSNVPRYLQNLANVIAGIEQKHAANAVLNSVATSLPNDKNYYAPNSSASYSGRQLSRPNYQISFPLSNSANLPGEQRTDNRGERGRSRYSVQRGDSLESIALKVLGDERFAQLLLTINRAEVVPSSAAHGIKFKPVPGHELLLPADQELAIHRKHFFCQKKNDVTGRMKALTDEAISRWQSQSAGKEKSAVAGLFEQLKNIGSKTTFSHPQDAQTSVRQDVNERVTTPRFDSRAPQNEQPAANYAAPQRRENTTFDARPAIEFAPQLDSIAADEDFSICKLSSNCRLLLADQNTRVFTIKLQTRVQNRWRTIAAYESAFGCTHRKLEYIEGHPLSFDVDLPYTVAREMAREDFFRNWRQYYQMFVSSAIASKVAF